MHKSMSTAPSHPPAVAPPPSLLQVGDIMGHFVADSWGLPDPTSLVVVGAAAVLGASCRAPLTAIALMVEITRDTGLLVPLLSAIGVASLFTDYLEGIFSKRLEQVGVIKRRGAGHVGC